MTINKKVIPMKFFVCLWFLFFSLFVIVYADIFPKGETKIAINPSFVSYNENISSDINIDAVQVDIDQDTDVGIIQYVVQPGDTLGKIARMFGTTTTTITKVNKINGSITDGQTLIITDDDAGFLYTVPQDINIAIFAQKYKLPLEEIMSLNYIQDESEILYKGQDIFINVNKDQACGVGLLDCPDIIVIQPKIPHKPYVNKPEIRKPQIRNQFFSSEDEDEEQNNAPGRKSTIISQWVFKKDIKNSFYPGYCTWYAAILSPEVFPYTAENKQERQFGGNAREWCENAKKAGFRVGSKPVAGALIVYKKGGRLVYAGHVGKVLNYYPDDGKMIIRDMNRVGKFIVTERREETDNDNIKCYIYGK